MRVVFVTHNYPRTSDDVAGAFLHPLALALVDRGVDVRVVAPSDRGRGGSGMLDGVPVTRVRYASAENETYAYTGTMREAMTSVTGIRALRSMVSSLRREAARVAAEKSGSVVHAHWWVPAGMAAPVGVPLVITCHGTDARLLTRGGIVQWLGRRVLRRADVVTTVSKALASTITERTGVDVAPDAIQPMPVTDVERNPSRGGGGLIVIGRLTPQKRVDLALRAFAALRERGNDLSLRIVGDGVERPRLEELAREYKVNAHVRFMGEVAPDAIPALLETADGLLMTAQEEGLGLVAAEAIMQGVPVVACTDGGGVHDVVPPAGAGRIVAPDAFVIAGAVEEMLADHAAARAARELASAWRERLSPRFVASRAVGWYERALRA